jgi:hypothetical protein
MKIMLNQFEIDALKMTKLEDRSKGGFQSLMCKLQDQLNDHALRLEFEDLVRIAKYAAFNESSGGYQGRLQKVFGRTLGGIVSGIRDSGQKEMDLG